MHKNPHQNAGNGIKETQFFKIFLGSMPQDPPRGSREFVSASPPPPQISKPVRLCRQHITQNTDLTEKTNVHEHILQ